VSEPVVVALDEQLEPIDIDRWSTLARRSLRHEGVERGELSLLFVTAEAMGELNHEHMGRAGPTDVLSFPIDAVDEHDVGELLLGDVVICPEYAVAHAADHRVAGEHDGGADDEIALLVVHGVLHVLGHDHAGSDEATSMRARERALLHEYHRA
jgi:probable rRNA maturation factor